MPGRDSASKDQLPGYETPVLKASAHRTVDRYYLEFCDCTLI